MATMQHKILCVRAAVQCVFHLRFNIQPPTRKSICHWNHQFEQIGCLCKGKSSGRSRVSKENVRRIHESFECSPCKSTHRANRELGILQPTVWCVLRCRLLFFLNHPVLLRNIFIICFTKIKTNSGVFLQMFLLKL